MLKLTFTFTNIKQTKLVSKKFIHHTILTIKRGRGDYLVTIF
jgi:hypothetical protein